jgi:hypothetical protein
VKSLLLALALTLSSASALACECSEYPVETDPVVESLLKKSFGNDIVIKKSEYGDMESEWLKAYPTLMERIFAADYRGSSCEIIGPNEESLMMCAGKYKSDYRYFLKLASGTDCTADIQVKASIKKASAKLLRTTCR